MSIKDNFITKMMQVPTLNISNIKRGNDKLEGGNGKGDRGKRCLNQ